MSNFVNFLTFEKDTKAYLQKRIAEFGKSPDNLALLHCNGELINLLKECTNRALAMIGQTGPISLKKTRYVDKAATPADAARGPSNIRKQRASQRAVNEAKQVTELQKLFADAGLDIRFELARNTPNTVAWFERRKQEQAARQTKEMFNDLMEIGGSNLVFCLRTMKTNLRTMKLKFAHFSQG